MSLIVNLLLWNKTNIILIVEMKPNGKKNHKKEKEIKGRLGLI